MESVITENVMIDVASTDVASASTPIGFTYQRRYQWIDYPAEAPTEQYREDPSNPDSPMIEGPARWWSPRCVGFRAKILVNPRAGEARRSSHKWRSVITGEAEEQVLLEEIADRVLEWDYFVIEEDKSRRRVVSPAAGGWEQFYELPSEVFLWLRDEIIIAHHSRKLTTTG